MDSTDIRNSLLDELIGQMEDSLAEKHYPSEKPKEEPAIETVEEAPKAEAKAEDEEEILTDEDMAALEAVQGE